MVQAHTFGVDLAWIRPGSDKPRQPISRIGAIRGRIRTVGKWEGIQNLLERSRYTCAQIGVGNVVYGSRLRLQKPEPLIRKEEKRLVLSGINARYPDRTAQGSSKIILTEGGFSCSKEIIEPVVRVKSVVSQILEGCTMPLICTRASHERELPAGRAPVFSRIGRGLNPELLESIYRNQTLRCSKRRRHRKSAAK